MDEFVAPRRIGVAPVFQYAAGMEPVGRPAHDKVIGGRSVEVDDAERRLLPADAIGGYGVEQAFFTLGFTVRIPGSPVQWRPIRRLVDDEGFIPALEAAFVFVVDDVGIHVVQARFPGFGRVGEVVFDEERVGGVLLQLTPSSSLAFADEAMARESRSKSDDVMRLWISAIWGKMVFSLQNVGATLGAARTQ